MIRIGKVQKKVRAMLLEKYGPVWPEDAERQLRKELDRARDRIASKYYRQHKWDPDKRKAGQRASYYRHREKILKTRHEKYWVRRLELNERRRAQWREKRAAMGYVIKSKGAMKKGRKPPSTQPTMVKKKSQSKMRLLHEQAEELSWTTTSRLGLRMRHVLVYLCEQRNDILNRGIPAEMMEMERIGVPWVLDGPEVFRAACRNSLATLEQRGMVLRQYHLGCPDTGRPRTSPQDWHIRTTHVHLLPSGLLVGKFLLDRLTTLRHLAEWPNLSPRQRSDVILHLIEWRCRQPMRRTQVQQEVLKLIKCEREGTDPVKALPVVSQFGRNEVNWVQTPVRLRDIPPRITKANASKNRKSIPEAVAKIINQDLHQGFDKLLDVPELPTHSRMGA